MPVAAILIATIRLHFLDLLLHLKYRGANGIHRDAHFDKGAEMGWLQHGSTSIAFAPKGFTLCPGIAADVRVRMDQRLMNVTPG